MTTDHAGTGEPSAPTTPVAGVHRTVPPGGTEVLASDAERERVTQRLRAAAVEGRLTLAESDERQALAYAARTREELGPLVADLPRTQRPVRPQRGPLSQRARLIFGAHLAVTALIFLTLVIGWAFSPVWFFWPFWPAFFLGLALFVHFRRAEREPGPEPMPENLR